MGEPQPEAAESGAAGTSAPSARGGRRSGRRAAGGRAAPRAGTSAGTVTMQARVDAGFARELAADAAGLGFRASSEPGRGRLRLVPQQTRERGVAGAYH